MPEIPVPHPDVVTRRLDDSVVLVHLQTNRIFTLNRTGGRIWELLVAGKPQGDIETALRREFEVDGEQAGRELASLVEQLVSEGLLVPGGRTAR